MKELPSSSPVRQDHAAVESRVVIGAFIDMYRTHRSAANDVFCDINGGVRPWRLFEFGDQQWFPPIFREAETAYLATAYRVFPMLARGWAERIATVLPQGEPAEILDLCSGSGGAMPMILGELSKRGYEVRAKLTDLHPHPKSVSHAQIEWLTEPVDATQVPPMLTGVRTMFSAFHHFPPEAAQAILRDAFERRRTICIFESGCGTLLGVAAMFWVPLAVLALMPFVRPFRWAYLLFTYLIPVIPVTIFWDGIVSKLRVYSPQQLQKLTAVLEAPDYAWEIGQIKVGGLPDRLPYLLGRRVP